MMEAEESTIHRIDDVQLEETTSQENENASSQREKHPVSRLREWELEQTRPLSARSSQNSTPRSTLRRRNSSDAMVHHVDSLFSNEDENCPSGRIALSPRALKLRASVSPTYTKPEEKLDVSPQGQEDGCLICMDSFTARRKAYPVPCNGTCVGASVHYRCIMAWLGQSGTCPLCRGQCDPLVLRPTESLDFSDLKKLVISPIPLDAGIVRCYVKQIKRGMFKQYSYELYMQSPLGSQEPDRLLLTAQKQIRSNMTANYIISTDLECTEENRVGRMGANFLGTVFTMYDTGRDPQKIAKIRDSTGTKSEENVLQIREELGCVTYEANRTSVGPRKMRVCIPEVDEETCAVKVFRPTSRQDRLVNRLASSELRDLRKFTNREPVFREDLGAYCLDFGGRVSMASVKNFQLISEDDPSMGNILQFGRIGADMFTMDFQWPLSAFQALAISLSSCDTKLACV